MFVLLLENDRKFRNEIEKHFYNILKTGNFFWDPYTSTSKKPIKTREILP